MDVLYVVRDITEEKSRELMYQKQLKASKEDAHRANLSNIKKSDHKTADKKS